MNSQITIQKKPPKINKIAAWARSLPKSKALALILGIYLLSIVVSWFEIKLLLKSPLNPFVILLITDLTATLIVYLFSTLFDNASVYDPYWSVIPIPIIIYYWIFNPQWLILTFPEIIVFILVLMWGIRLTTNWISYWSGFDFEDWRYRDFRNKNPQLFWLINLFGIQLFPTLIVFAGCLSLWPTFADPLPQISPFSLIGFIIGVLIVIGAVSLEFFADRQMHRFLSMPENRGTSISEGLWKYSRHPNYLGEVSFWWGLYIIGLSLNPEYWWSIIGPITITLLFLFISIPMMEKHNLSRRKDYLEYMNKTSKFIPRKPRK